MKPCAVANRVQLTTDGHHPAMEAGIADHAWSVEEIVGLLEG
jgi:hypothetical protein